MSGNNTESVSSCSQDVQVQRVPINRNFTEVDFFKNFNDFDKFKQGGGRIPFRNGIGPIMQNLGVSMHGMQNIMMNNGFMGPNMIKIESKNEYKRDEGIIYEDDKPMLQNIVST